MIMMMMIPSSRVYTCSITLLLLSQSPNLVTSFCTPNIVSVPSWSSRTRLDYSSSSSSNSHHNQKNANNHNGLSPPHWNLSELERARAELEGLMDGHPNDVPPSGVILGASAPHRHHHHPLPFAAAAATSSSSRRPAVVVVGGSTEPPLLLTSTGRRLRELEMALIGSLRDSDAGIEELIHLWTTERDEGASNALLHMQTVGQCSSGLVTEEAALRQLCGQYPGWAEPWSRLGTLHYYQGRTADAVDAAEQATFYKPWHFEALNVCVLLLAEHQKQTRSSSGSGSSSGNAVGARDDAEGWKSRAVRLARRALPPLNAAERNEARHVWVARALTQASLQIQHAEQATVSTTFDCERVRTELASADVWQ